MHCRYRSLKFKVGRFPREGYTAVEIVDSEKPVDAILTTAAKRKTDLIVTGAQGLGAVARFFLGSVSYQVAQHATCSVLIVR